MLNIFLPLALTVLTVVFVDGDSATKLNHLMSLPFLVGMSLSEPHIYKFVLGFVFV